MIKFIKWISKLFREDKMLFKEPQMEQQYNNAPQKLKDIADSFTYISIKNKVIPMITRVTDPVRGDSGVHEEFRAFDFRNQYVDNGSQKWLYPIETVDEIVNYINTRYPRDDGKPTLMHHSFQGGAFHFHMQIPYSWLTKEEENKYAIKLIK